MSGSAAGEKRRASILAALAKADEPLLGTALSKMFDVSRQVVVQDIALLRVQGHDIQALHRGYVLQAPAGQAASAHVRLEKVRHSAEEIEDELNTIVDLGGCVVDVIVNHRVYGQLTEPLNVKSRRDVKRFMEDIRKGASRPLSAITSGYHYHHIEADSEEILDEIEQALREKGYLIGRRSSVGEPPHDAVEKPAV